MYDDNECSLVVLNARPEDSGVYTCTARNLAGSVSCKAELTVHEGKDLINWSRCKSIDTLLNGSNQKSVVNAAKSKEDPVEDEETILRKMRRLTDHYDLHKEIGR